MKSKSLLIFVLLALLGCTKQKIKNYEFSDFIFGSYVRIKVAAQDSLQAHKAFTKAMQTFYHIDSVASVYNPESELSRLNKNGSALLSADLKSLIIKSLEVSENSDGAFDITVGSVMKSWGFYEDTGITASDFQFDIDYKKIRINGDSIFLEPNMALDLGGIAVGYAVDKACEVLKAERVKNGLIDAGGEIICFGEESYKIGIKNPNGEGIISAFFLKGQAVSTSGNYERYIERGNKRYSHIINPKRASPIEKSSSGLCSVTIIANKCVDADAYATAVFVLGLKDGQKLIRKLGLQGVLSTQDGKIVEVK